MIIIVTLNSRGYEEVEFGFMESFPVDLNFSQATVYVLQEDQLNPGRIIAALENSLVSLSTNGNMTVIAGEPMESGIVNGPGTEARFNGILGMFQLSDSTIILSDHKNHCLRLLNRSSNVVSTYSGKCNTTGYRDGTLDQALFTLPVDLVAMDSKVNQIAVVEFAHGRIRYLHIREQMVTTAGTLGIELTYLLKGSDFFYISARFGVMEVIDGVADWLTGSLTPGSKDGVFSNASFSNPRGIIIVGSSNILMADPDVHRLRFLDRRNSTVTSLCPGQRGYADGTLHTCQLCHPFSLLAVNNTLYIGENTFCGGGLRQINFKGTCGS